MVASESWHRNSGSGQSGSVLGEERSPCGLDLGLRPGTAFGQRAHICLLSHSARSTVQSQPEGRGRGWAESVLTGVSSYSLISSTLSLLSPSRAVTCLWGESREGGRKRRRCAFRILPAYPSNQSQGEDKVFWGRSYNSGTCAYLTTDRLFLGRALSLSGALGR